MLFRSQWSLYLISVAIGIVAGPCKQQKKMPAREKAKRGSYANQAAHKPQRQPQPRDNHNSPPATPLLQSTTCESLKVAPRQAAEVGAAMSDFRQVAIAKYIGYDPWLRLPYPACAGRLGVAGHNAPNLDAVFGTVAASSLSMICVPPVSKMDECINFCRIRWAEVICVSVIARAQWCQRR